MMKRLRDALRRKGHVKHEAKSEQGAGVYFVRLEDGAGRFPGQYRVPVRPTRRSAASREDAWCQMGG